MGSNYFRKLAGFIHSARQVSRDPNLDVNEELFWDYYARDWVKSKNGEYVGSEWKFEEDFLALLQKYAAPDKEALEIGCGGGRITATGVKLFKHVYAADFSMEMLRRAKAAINDPVVTFHKIDGFTLKEFSDSSVDFVYSHDVFVQLSPIQVYPYFMEIERVLKKGGMGLVSFYDFVDQFEMFKRTSMKFWTKRMFPAYRRIHYITLEMINAILSDVGLTIIEVEKRRFLSVAFRK